jgi:hypothetical protein
MFRPVGMRRVTAAAFASAVLALSVGAAAAQSPPCRSFQFKMSGAAGQSCEHLMPLSWDTRRGERGLHERAYLTREPAHGQVTFTVDRPGNRLIVRYRPNGKEPVTDSFVFDRCGRSSSGEGCISVKIAVDLSDQGARQSAEACVPSPFQLQPGREVPVELKGARGGTCLIRLFLANTPLKIDIETPPQSGRAWLRGPRVLYRGGLFGGQDRFRVRVCARDGSERCTILNVAVSLS